MLKHGHTEGIAMDAKFGTNHKKVHIYPISLIYCEHIELAIPDLLWTHRMINFAMNIAIEWWTLLYHGQMDAKD
jgi:hypothetical protein